MSYKDTETDETNTSSDELETETQVTETDTAEGDEKDDEQEPDVAGLVDSISQSNKDRDTVKNANVSKWLERAKEAETQSELDEVLDEAPSWVRKDVEAKLETPSNVPSWYKNKEFTNKFKKLAEGVATEHSAKFKLFSKKAKELRSKHPTLSASELVNMAKGEMGIAKTSKTKSAKLPKKGRTSSGINTISESDLSKLPQADYDKAKERQEAGKLRVV